MAVTVSVENYRHYGKCVKMENEFAELYVTVDVGPRAVHYALKGKENMLFNDDNEAVNNFGPEYDETFFEGARWHIYGGHRLWLSPEKNPDTYYPDNDPVEYEILENGAVFIPKPQIHNNIQYKLTYTLDAASARVTLKQEVRNLSRETIRRALWGITVMDKEGVEIIPQPTKDTGLLANRVLAVWAYSDLSDERIKFGKEYITLKQDPQAASNFKIGINNEKGWVAYANKGCVFKVQYDVNEQGDYPDYGVSLETYTSNLILEVETLGELHDIEPDGTACHIEHWDLKPVEFMPVHGDESSVKRFVETYLA
ncbi:hypothetical protein [Candidatus Soleaferrea massiliensis]|uniref:hypothetical protein n=1 Tax=Candidatus Soleaferrea massiliensis TaxID=1470354 RepID=UPI00058F595F|nr:hypothetical protein [Candidatus Soleaferrea massiliensis]